MRNLFLLLLTSPCSRAWDLQSWWARGVCRDTMGQPDPAPAMLCLIEHVDERATQRQRQRERDGLRKSARRRRGVVGQCVVTNVPHHSALSHASLYILSTGWSRKCPPPPLVFEFSLMLDALYLQFLFTGASFHWMTSFFICRCKQVPFYASKF